MKDSVSESGMVESGMVERWKRGKVEDWEGGQIGQRGHYNCCNLCRGKGENGNEGVVVNG